MAPFLKDGRVPISQLKTLRYIAADAAAKAKVIWAKFYAGIFYGMEAKDLSQGKLATLTASVTDVFRARNNNHDTDWFFACCSEGKGLDPVH